MKSLRPTFSTLRPSVPPRTFRPLCQCLHTTVIRSATVTSVPPPSDALERVARKRRQADLLKQAQDVRQESAPSSKPKSLLKKRFWKDVVVRETDEGLQVYLDSRPVRMANKEILTVPKSKHQLATAIALEWDHLLSAQQALKTHYIPMTSLAARALDIETADAQGNEEVRTEILKMLMRYLHTDTLLCWAPAKVMNDSLRDGKTLRQVQIETSTPIIAHITTHIWPGVEIKPILEPDSIMPVAQPEMTQQVIHKWLLSLPAFELAGLERAVLATKSLLVSVRLIHEWANAFALTRNNAAGTAPFGIEEAAEASSLEVRWQTGQWGEVEDTHDVEKEDLRRQLGSAIILVSGGAQHKRSKSQKVKNMLGRVSSKSDVTTTDHSDTSPPGSSAAGSQHLGSSSQHLPGHQRSLSKRHHPHLSASMSNVTTDGLSPASPSYQPSPNSPTPKGSSIEQSVKLFRVFESLRNGDTAAISKAIRDQSASPSDSEEGRSSLSLPNARTEGTSILHLAIQCAELPVIEFVLSNATSAPDSPIDINGRDRDGNTPLHLAATLGRTPVVRMLLDRPDINDSITNYNGQTPLDLARTPDIFQQLQLARSIFIDTNVNKIHELVVSGDMVALEQILQDGRIKSTIDVNGGELATDPIVMDSGGTLLHEAAKKKDVKLAQLLLLNGADPFRRDRKGKLPQDYTKDDRTRAILKRSPAAAAAQRGIQEKTILAGSSQGATAMDSGMGSKESREMKGYLKKWTNYTSGYKLRWFVLEDGVLSYYKHQDDTGSACRGAINMKIAKLYMDPQDKQRFEIQGKSSVKYHLKANHQVEAKRWFWALNNSIQFAKDEARVEEKRATLDHEALKQAKIEQLTAGGDTSSVGSSRMTSSRNAAPTASSLGVPLMPQDTFSRTAVSIPEDAGSAYEASVTGQDTGRVPSHFGATTVADDMDDDDDYDDDESGHEVKPQNKDAFNITAQSAKLQLDLLTSVATALQSEKTKNPTLQISDPTMLQALASYDSAIGNLKGLIGDLLRISRDRDAYWQYRLDREANVRRMWEESMAKVAKEQEELEERIGESEQKRRKTKRALREALEDYEKTESAPDPAVKDDEDDFVEATEDPEHRPEATRKPSFQHRAIKRKATIADIAADMSDSESEDDEEFFDAVGAGEVEVIELPQEFSEKQDLTKPSSTEDFFEKKYAEIATGFKGYEDGPRKRLAMDADDRPKISLWGILKSMIGKDMTKMTLPVSFNEPTSLLQRVAEDMEYTDLLDTAADRTDSTERLLYVAAFAASEYASTTGRVAKPFNPLLAETYEYARPDKGYRFFIEQVSHHPPIGAAYAESKKWDYYGESAVKSKFYGRSFDINPLGTWFLRLRPTSNGGKEELYTWKKVTSSVIGIITGNPVVDNYGPMEIRNHTTGEVCLLEFKARGWKASSAFQVVGKVLDAEGRVRWSVGGRWNDKIYARFTPGFEDADIEKGGSKTKHDESKAFLVWQVHERPTGIPFNLTPFVVTLNDIPDKLRPTVAPTDTRLRPDQRAMEDGEYDLAATEKNRVEEKQRATRREREANGDHFVPRWFSKGTCDTTGEEYWVFNHEYWKIRDKVAKGETTWQEAGLEDIF
ncbi:Oxysterol-binding protein-domain-containing protein [Phaeosphaeriaceae sp. PMI808]|nr:Oxysterol-binding protein-domain-containing protein [Phaeosphaeriaceae sp. PMI808]